MKQSLIKVSSIFLASMAAWGSAHAQSNQGGSISVGGTVSPVTCQVSASDRNKTISMGIINPSTLTNVGQTSPRKPFTIAIEGCSTPGNGHPSRAAVKFSGQYINTATSNLELINVGQQGVASGLQARVLNGNGSQVMLAAADQQVIPINLQGGTTNVLNFMTEYIVTSTPVGAGKADTAVDFELTYP